MKPFPALVGALPDPQSPAPIPPRVEVAVIGAGYTGLGAAIRLARHGAEVCVLEAHHAGWGASSRNGGMVLSGLKLSARDLVARFGAARAKEYDAAALRSIDAIAALIRDEQIDCDFTRCGHLALAAKPAHFEQMRREAEFMSRNFDRPLSVIPSSELANEVESHAFYGALLDESSGGLNPARFVNGLAAAARRAGATLCEDARVTALERMDQRGSGYKITTVRGATFARQVVVATGAYVSAIDPVLRDRVLPVGSYIIATEPLDDELAHSLSRRGRMMFDSLHFLHYFRLTPDRRFLFGGRASFVPESDAAVAQSATILRRDMLRMFPQLAHVAIDHAWGGTIDFTFDMLPHAGQRDGIHYAVGYAGHGVAMATYLGGQVAASLLGEPIDGILFEQPLPSAPFGMSAAARWMLPLAGAWFRLLDLVS